jgi:hypothetical protein
MRLLSASYVSGLNEGEKSAYSLSSLTMTKQDFRRTAPPPPPLSTVDIAIIISMEHYAFSYNEQYLCRVVTLLSSITP